MICKKCKEQIDNPKEYCKNCGYRNRGSLALLIDIYFGKIVLGICFIFMSVLLVYFVFDDIYDFLIKGANGLYLVGVTLVMSLFVFIIIGASIIRTLHRFDIKKSTTQSSFSFNNKKNNKNEFKSEFNNDSANNENFTIQKRKRDNIELKKPKLQKIITKEPLENDNDLDSLEFDFNIKQKKLSQVDGSNKTFGLFSKNSIKNVYLILKENQKDEMHIPIGKDKFTIGRDRNNDFAISSNKISGKQAIIKKKADGFEVADCASLNGTYVNGEKLQKNIYRKIKNNDILMFANIEIKFKEK